MFLALQVLLLLVGAGLCVWHIRLGLAVWLALTAHFVSFMWMTLPNRHFPVQAALFGGLYLLAGVCFTWRRARLPWWALPAATLGVFAVLRSVMWLYWLLRAPISGVSLDAMGRSTLVLVVPAVLALLVAQAAMALLLRGPAVRAS